MQNQVEEIVLLSTKDERKHRHEDDVFVRIQTPSNHHSTNKQHSNILKRLFIPTNQSNVYKNLVLWVVLFGGLFVLAAPLALHLSYALPAIRPRTIPLHEFSEERARDFYPNLTQYGPRVGNTQADYLTRDFLLSQISRIRSMAKPFVQFEISLQNFPENNIDQLQNIAVRLFDSNSSPDTPCLMLTAHYDSVEFSPGGSDDGSGVVILLELLSNLVMDPSITFSQVHLIALFTAGEEMNLAGAEAFVASHPWKNKVRRFINLDSMGGHEKAILVQVKPSQLVYDYHHVPRPHANVIGDEMFDHLGFQTDYNAFTSKGSLLGYDFAFYLDGYSYHTSLDKPSVVEEGALQHLGENTLVLARRILVGKVNLEQPEAITDEDNIIYFDILGRHLVTYRKTTSVIIQLILISLIIIVGLTIITVDHIWSRKNPSIDDFTSIYFYFKHPLFVRLCSIIIFFVCYVLSMMFGIAFTLLMAFILSKFCPLSWYGNATLSFFLYGLFCLIGMILCEILWTFCRRWFLLKYSKKNPMELNAINHIDRLCFNFERHHSLLLVLVMLMSVSICSGYRSSYLVLVWSIFICPIYLVIMLVEFIFRWLRKKYRNLFNEQGWYWLFAPYIVSLVPLIHTLEMTSRLIRLAIPMMGRVFHETILSQDLTISLLIAVPTILFFLIFIPNAQRMMNYGRILLLLTVSCLIVLLIACVRQRFTSMHPRIVYVRHQSNTSYLLTDPQISPMTIPMHSQAATITIGSYDKLLISPILDQFSRKTGHSLNGRKCMTPSSCSFDDSFNRTIPFKQVELTSTDDWENYQFIIRHLPSYQIIVTPSKSIEITVHNATIKPRTETMIDVRLTDPEDSFRLKLTINRCDLNDSPFLLSLTKTFSSIVLWGAGHCETFTDTLYLVLNKSRL